MVKNEINEEEIKIMTKLAIYDKTHGPSDRVANGLYYRDYVYRKNFFIRFCALIGCMMPIGLYVVTIFTDDTLDFLAYDYMGLLISLGTIIAVVMIAYTFIGTRIATEEYKDIKLRLKTYFTLIRELETLKSENEPEAEEEGEEYDDNELEDEQMAAARKFQEERYQQRRNYAKEVEQRGKTYTRSDNGRNDRNTRERN